MNPGQVYQVGVVGSSQHATGQQTHVKVLLMRVSAFYYIVLSGKIYNLLYKK